MTKSQSIVSYWVNKKNDDALQMLLDSEPSPWTRLDPAAAVRFLSSLPVPISLFSLSPPPLSISSSPHLSSPPLLFLSPPPPLLCVSHPLPATPPLPQQSQQMAVDTESCSARGFCLLKERFLSPIACSLWSFALGPICLFLKKDKWLEIRLLWISLNKIESRWHNYSIVRTHSRVFNGSCSRCGKGNLTTHSSRVLLHCFSLSLSLSPSLYFQ